MALLAASAPAPAAALGPSPFASGAGAPGGAAAWRVARSQGSSLRALCKPLPPEVWAHPAPDSWDTVGRLQLLLGGGGELAVEPHTPPRPDAAAGGLTAHGAQGMPDTLTALASPKGGADLSDGDGDALAPMVRAHPCSRCWVSTGACNNGHRCALVS